MLQCWLVSPKTKDWETSLFKTVRNELENLIYYQAVIVGLHSLWFLFFFFQPTYTHANKGQQELLYIEQAYLN